MRRRLNDVWVWVWVWVWCGLIGLAFGSVLGLGLESWEPLVDYLLQRSCKLYVMALHEINVIHAC